MKGQLLWPPTGTYAKELLTTMPALIFSPDLKTNSPDPEGGNLSACSPKMRSILRARNLDSMDLRNLSE